MQSSYAPENLSQWAAAPFLVQLPTGQLVASFQTNEVRPGNGDQMGIVVSCDNGTTWVSRPRPFTRIVQASYWWNSLFVDLPGGDLLAATSAWGVGPDKIKVIRGHLEIEPQFRRGDSNDDGAVDISDATFTLEWLFTDGPSLGCVAAADTNGEGIVDISDPLWLFFFLFVEGRPPVDPFSGCGLGSLDTDRELGCVTPPENCPVR